MQKKNKKKKFSIKKLIKGFTLVELLAVIVILAIIMIIAIPNVLSVLNTSKQKTFGQYVTKVYTKAQEQRVSDSYLGIKRDKYDITKDLGLASTGSFKGYVLFTRNSNNEEQVYIALTDGEYNTATQYGEDESTRVNYINYTVGGEPTYSQTLSRYNGKNSFIKGNLADITIPDSQSSPDFIELTGGSTTTEDDFSTKLKVFYNKAYGSFKTAISNNTVTKKQYSCDENHDHGYINVEHYDYKTLTGDTSATSDGFITIMESHLKYDDGSSIPFKLAYIAFRDKNYHTGTKLIYYMNGSQSSIVLPYSVYGTFFNEINYKSSVVDSTPVFDQEEYGNDLTRIINASEALASELIPTFESKYYPSIRYVSNSVADGLGAMNVYTYNQFKSTYYMEPEQLIYDYITSQGWRQV